LKAQVFFTASEDAKKHIKAGLGNNICAYKSVDIPNVVHGVNSADGKTDVFSCASCTTNNISPVVEVLGRRIESKKHNDNSCLHSITSNSRCTSKRTLEWDVQELTI
jgi:glyceraldehyde 3-phosphate dehydrogenase